MAPIFSVREVAHAVLASVVNRSRSIVNVQWHSEGMPFMTTDRLVVADALPRTPNGTANRPTIAALALTNFPSY